MKQKLLSATIGAHGAVPTGDIDADGATTEVLRGTKGRPASAKRIQNEVADVAVELDQSARQLCRELARMIEITLRGLSRNGPHVARPRLEFLRREVRCARASPVRELAGNEHRLRDRSQHRIAGGAPGAPRSGRDDILRVESLYPGELFPRQKPDLLERRPESRRHPERPGLTVCPRRFPAPAGRPRAFSRLGRDVLANDVG